MSEITKKLETGTRIKTKNYDTGNCAGQAVMVRNRNGDYPSVFEIESVKCADGIVDRAIVKKEKLEALGFLVLTDDKTSVPADATMLVRYKNIFAGPFGFEITTECFPTWRAAYETMKQEAIQACPDAKTEEDLFDLTDSGEILFSDDHAELQDDDCSVYAWKLTRFGNYRG